MIVRTTLFVNYTERVWRPRGTISADRPTLSPIIPLAVGETTTRVRSFRLSGYTKSKRNIFVRAPPPSVVNPTDRRRAFRTGDGPVTSVTCVQYRKT